MTIRLAFAAGILVALPLCAQSAKLVLTPDHLDMSGPGDRHRVLVARVDDKGRQDVTGDATYESEQARVVTVTKGGEVHAAAFGETTVTVRVGNLSAELPVTVANDTGDGVPSFVNEVLPLLTRLGCNGAACHGKATGQNGFRLSLHGTAPELDHRWLTREYAGRRGGADADESLLLRKATGRTPHEGGALVRAAGREHAMLRNWLESGSPAARADEPTARRLEILPGPLTLRVGTVQRLLARAEFAPGVWRDVTWLTRFDANDADTATVTPAGRVTAVRIGKTVVRAAYRGQVAAVGVTIP